MNLGPYKISGNTIVYKGNNIFPPINLIKGVEPQDLSKRHFDIKSHSKWPSLMKIYDSLHKAVSQFMEKRGVLLFDLPIITRMISSPGALTGVIPSDVDPFEIKFFDYSTFLTQSSQLYLEFAINANDINEVWCWDKSFRREIADFRHLPEFTHVEYEGRVNFEKNLEIQEDFLKFIINFLIENKRKDLELFITNEDLNGLNTLIKSQFERISFHEAFNLLFEATKDEKYKAVTIKNFNAFEEILLTELVGNKPLFVTNYIGDEVAFYHAPLPENPSLVKNADLMFPGYGELIGSGERVNTKEETEKKAQHFQLDMEDYRAYIESRDPVNPVIHSGWGMGMERFLQCILKLPFIWEAKIFPRVHNSNKP